MICGLFVIQANSVSFIIVMVIVWNSFHCCDFLKNPPIDIKKITVYIYIYRERERECLFVEYSKVETEVRVSFTI